MSKNNELLNLLNPYNQSVYLPSIDKDVSYKPITTGQMKNILTYNGDDPGVIENILDDIIKKCTDTEFDIDDLTLTDRHTLLIKIRTITKGEVYSFNIKCPECKTMLYRTINVNDYQDVPYPKDIDKKVDLSDNLSIYLELVTRRMQKKAYEIVKEKYKNKKFSQYELAEIGTYIYALAISKFETPMGVIENSPVDDKKEFLDSLTQNMFEKITNWYDKYSYGMKLTYSPNCDLCGYKADDEEIPITDFLFSNT